METTESPSHVAVPTPKTVAPVNAPTKKLGAPSSLELDFLSDAEALERAPLPWIARSTLYVLLAMLISGVIWSCLAKLDQIASAHGKLVTTPSSIIVQPLETSSVRSIEVKIGQTVHRGQILATLDPTFSAADFNQLLTKKQSLSAEIDRCKAELDNADTFPASNDDPERMQQAILFKERQGSYRARLKHYEATIQQISIQLKDNEHTQKILEEKLKGVKEIVRMHDDLYRSSIGAGSRLKVLEADDSRLGTLLQYQQSQDKEAELKQQLTVQTTERDTYIREWRQKLAEDMVKAERDLVDVVEQFGKAQRRHDLVIMTAPAEAVVLEIADRAVGSIIKEAEPLFTLVPLDVPLEAEVQVGPDDVGFIKIGDEARIKVDAFPFQKHGMLNGSVLTISENAFTKDGPGGRPTAETFYRARLDLGPMTLRLLPPGGRLMPGMTVNSEILVGRRRAITYFLYPLIKGLDESLRER